jgi:ABC-type multidrug transport system fused ATPase/permease subunit
MIRSSLTTIPQDPVKMTGTIRHNLDPEGKVQSEDLYVEVLRKTGIWHIIEGRGGLDADLGELGFSIGQQQLFCLARALLLRNKIVLLDESTSSVDGTTDREIRRIVTNEMKDKTVIEVLHRLDIVKDFDLVIVMGQGSVLEAGEPKELLSRPSELRRLVENQGI